MLENIKKILFSKYAPTDIKGLFLTTFDTQGAIISSNGTVEPEKSLDQLVELLYHGLIEKESNVAKVIVDVVTEITQASDMAQIQAINLQQQGLCLVGEQGKSWAILPNTKWVSNLQQALVLVKEKYQLAGNATIYAFKTDRLLVQ